MTNQRGARAGALEACGAIGRAAGCARLARDVAAVAGSVAAVVVSIAMLDGPGPARAEPGAWRATPSLGGPAAPLSPPPADLLVKRSEREARQGELETVEQALRNNIELQKRLEAEIKAIDTDRARLDAALIASAERIRAAEARMAASEARLDALTAREAGLRRSLAARRETIVEVLAALQRMGRSPPPAVLVRAEDMLEAIRASIVLGAVLPQLRAEAETLAADLADLVRLRQAIGVERKQLSAEIGDLAGERTRLAALMEARQAKLAEARRSAGEEARHAADLAERAKTLRELLQQLESEIGAGGERERLAAERLARETRARLAAASLKDPARLEPKAGFNEARGRLALPVSGELLRGFGVDDGLGGKSQGLAIAARTGTVVTAPTDGSVAFAGPFRTFGQLLILNVGGGYYIVLAGMDRITVDLGQFVLAGEPVARMSERTAETREGSGETGPVLYVEFRKDGTSIDPAPWWPGGFKEKVRG